MQGRDYDLGEPLRAGGFGTCASAVDRKTGKVSLLPSPPSPLFPSLLHHIFHLSCCLPQLFAIKTNDDRMIDDLKSECNILSKIPEHNNIIKFYGAVLEECTSDSQLHFHLMMELAESECV